MILFQKAPPYTMSTEMPYHIVRKKSWKHNFVESQMMSMVVDTYCGEEFLADTKRKNSFKMKDVNKEERKKYKSKICQNCKEKIIREKVISRK